MIHPVLQAGKKKKGYKAAESPIFSFNFRDSGVSGVETQHLYQPALIALGGEERWPSLGGVG